MWFCLTCPRVGHSWRPGNSQRNSPGFHAGGCLRSPSTCCPFRPSELRRHDRLRRALSTARKLENRNRLRCPALPTSDRSPRQFRPGPDDHSSRRTATVASALHSPINAHAAKVVTLMLVFTAGAGDQAAISPSLATPTRGLVSDSSGWSQVARSGARFGPKYPRYRPQVGNPVVLQTAISVLFN